MFTHSSEMQASNNRPRPALYRPAGLKVESANTMPLLPITGLSDWLNNNLPVLWAPLWIPNPPTNEWKNRVDMVFRVYDELINYHQHFEYLKNHLDVATRQPLKTGEKDVREFLDTVGDVKKKVEDVAIEMKLDIFISRALLEFRFGNASHGI
ncbi:MAG: hypothetical protein Q9218_008095 [Villophora microphyllina]